MGLGNKRVFNPDFQYLYYWEKCSRGSCAWCAYKVKCEKVLEKGIKSQVKRSYSDYAFCKVNICEEVECWVQFHSVDVDY